MSALPHSPQKQQRLVLRENTSLELLEVRIQSERLLLCPVDESLAADLFLHFNEQIITYMALTVPKRIEESEDFITTSRKKMCGFRDLICSVKLESSGEFLGMVGLHSHKRGCSSPDIGVWIKKPAHGHGYGKEAVIAMINWAEKNLRVDSISYQVARMNFASRRIPEILGGKILDSVVFETADGRVLDELIYQIPLPLRQP